MSVVTARTNMGGLDILAGFHGDSKYSDVKRPNDPIAAARVNEDGPRDMNGGSVQSAPPNTSANSQSATRSEAGSEVSRRSQLDPTGQALFDAFANTLGVQPVRKRKREAPPSPSPDDGKEMFPHPIDSSNVTLRKKQRRAFRGFKGRPRKSKRIKDAKKGKVPRSTIPTIAKFFGLRKRSNGTMMDETGMVGLQPSGDVIIDIPDGDDRELGIVDQFLKFIDTEINKP
jgi:hypothetical protein